VSNFRFPHRVSSTRLMMFDLSWALMRLRPRRKLGRPFFEAMDLQGKVGNQLLQIVVIPSWFFRLRCPISWRVASLTVSRVRRAFPASMNSLNSLVQA